MIPLRQTDMSDIEAPNAEEFTEFRLEKIVISSDNIFQKKIFEELCTPGGPEFQSEGEQDGELSEAQSQN